MLQKLAPGFVALTQDACLKAHWRRSALRSFLLQHGISESKLASWDTEESKRDFLQRLFQGLVSIRDNKGHAVILAMARSLVEMRYFPDLENWEDSAEKISAAHKAVERVRDAVRQMDQEVTNASERDRRRKEAQDQRTAAIAATQTLGRLYGELTDLAPRQGTQEAGYAFERWFYDLVVFFEIQARPPYTASGRQIDGSLTLDGTTFLIETKFTKTRTDAPDVDAFMSKITRKADNTMGILISMSSFTETAVREASRDRTPMLLMDYAHFFNLVLNGRMSLPDVIRRMKRHASQTGEAFLPASSF
jgi:hypothetical protein